MKIILTLITVLLLCSCEEDNRVSRFERRAEFWETKCHAVQDELYAFKHDSTQLLNQLQKLRTRDYIMVGGIRTELNGPIDFIQWFSGDTVYLVMKK